PSPIASQPPPKKSSAAPPTSLNPKEDSAAPTTKPKIKIPSPVFSLLVASACVGFRSGLLRFGTGGAATSTMAEPGTRLSRVLVCGGAVVPVGVGIVYLPG